MKTKLLREFRKGYSLINIKGTNNYELQHESLQLPHVVCSGDFKICLNVFHDKIRQKINLYNYKNRREIKIIP